MDAREFEERLFPWIDGALPPDAAQAMEEHCAADPAARERAAAERAFDDRVRRALLADARGGESVARALVAVRAEASREEVGVSGAVARPGRLLGFPGRGAAGVAPARRPASVRRWAAGMAAAAAAVVGVMWFNCVPPFECRVLEALERAADAPAETTEHVGDVDRDRVSLPGEQPRTAWRSQVQGCPGVVVLECEDAPDDPSFRRAYRVGEESWWVADRGEKTVVAFRDPGDHRLWCFVGTQPEATLLDAVKRFRKERAGAGTTTERSASPK
jgi:hypothetical protein